MDFDIKNRQIAVVIPAYKVQQQIESVIKSIPSFITDIIVVNDASPDQTQTIVEKLAANDSRIHLVSHKVNKGVGGAMVSGFKKALERNNDIVVKMDGDGQMNSKYLLDLITPILENKADYTKGNRFYDFVALRQMPAVRRFGNTALGFLTKIATGYWNVFDPTNGYLAIRAEKLKQLRLENIAKTYYFETSMLSNLYLVNARVLDIPLPAVYQDEKSNLSIRKTILEFPPRLFKDFLKRILLRYFLYDFSMVSVYLLIGIPMLLFGLVFGVVKWIDYASKAVAAPAGTVVLPTLCVLLGIQFLISAIHIDIQSVPK